MAGEPWKPARLGAWVLEERLGAGAFGAVYAAHHADRPLIRRAVKLLSTRDEHAVARFRREAELLARVRHPGVVQIHEVGQAGPDAFYVMDLVEGRSLRAVLEETRGAGLPLARALPIALGLSRAVAAAHEAGVLHRDLKPENVLLSPGGEVHVVDFGLARAEDLERLTKTGTALGTPGYMAPEQIEGRQAQLGPPADVYSLGSILHELATGEPLFDGPPLAVLDAAVRGRFRPASAVRPGLPRALDHVLARALAPDPAARYPDAGAFATALADLELRRSSGTLDRSPAVRRGIGAGLAVALAAGCVGLALHLAGLAGPSDSRPDPVPRATPRPERTASSPSPRASGVAPTGTAIELETAPAWFRALAPAERPDRLPPGVSFGNAPREYVNGRDGSLLVFVPGGPVSLGYEELVGDPNERPVHEVVLSPYFVGKLEVSRRQFDAFVAATRHRTVAQSARRDPVAGPYVLQGEGLRIPRPGATYLEPRGDFAGEPGWPVVQVAWSDARAYCAWAGLRLPTEAEWERAACWDPAGARSTHFPWGNGTPKISKANVWLEGAPESSCVLGDVTDYPSSHSPVGALQMCGNAREWTLDSGSAPDFYERIRRNQVDRHDPCDLPASAASEDSAHCVRGGCYRDRIGRTRSAARLFLQGSDDGTGFRVALSLDGSPRPR